MGNIFSGWKQAQPYENTAGRQLDSNFLLMVLKYGNKTIQVMHRLDSNKICYKQCL